MKTIISLFIAVLIITQSGCISVLVGTAVTTATVVDMHDTSLGATIHDRLLRLKYMKNF